MSSELAQAFKMLMHNLRRSHACKAAISEVGWNWRFDASADQMFEDIWKNTREEWRVWALARFARSDEQVHALVEMLLREIDSWATSTPGVDLARQRLRADIGVMRWESRHSTGGLRARVSTKTADRVSVIGVAYTRREERVAFRERLSIQNFEWITALYKTDLWESREG